MSNQYTAADEPKRIFRKGTLSDIPKWDFFKELEKHVQYSRHGWIETRERKSVNGRSDAFDLSINILLNAITGNHTAKQLAEITGMNRQTANNILAVLMSRGLVVRDIRKQPYIYWRNDKADKH